MKMVERECWEGELNENGALDGAGSEGNGEGECGKKEKKEKKGFSKNAEGKKK